jgi:hypothetical protein
MDSKLQLIHEGYCKVQCSHSFISSQEIAEATSEQSKIDIKTAYEGLQTMLSEFQAKVHQMADKPKYSDFKVVDDYLYRFLVKFDKVHEVLGAAISRYVGAKMMKKIVGEANPTLRDQESGLKYGFEVMPESVYCKTYKFSNLMGELKGSIENMQTSPEISTSTVPTVSDEIIKDYEMKLQKERRRNSALSSKLIESVTFREKKSWKPKAPTDRKMTTRDVHNHLEIDDSDAIKIYPYTKDLHYKPKGGDQLNANTVLEIFGHYKEDRKFMDEVKELEFPKMKKLKIQRADCITSFEMIESVNKFMSTSFVHPLKYFKLSAWEYQCNLNKFIDGIGQLLQMVTDQIYISNCVLDEDVFETILEAGSQCSHIVLQNCKIEISETFMLDKTLEYKTKSLSLFQTLRKDDEDFISQEKFSILLNRMAETQLKNSLTTFSYLWKDYPVKEIDSLFSKHDFMVCVYADKHTPVEEE